MPEQIIKKLQFSEPLPQMVLDGIKDTSWRINDEKNITVDDILSLCYNNGREFARASVIWVKETRFKDFTEEDKEGHEKFSSDADMYSTYSRYYKIEVTPDTRVKVIKYRLI